MKNKSQSSEWKVGTILKAMKLGMISVPVSKIADNLKISRSTLLGWMNKVKEFGLTYDVAKQMSPEELKELLFSSSRPAPASVMPNWDEVPIQMGYPSMKLSRCYEQYRESVGQGLVPMSRSTFYREYEKQRSKLRPEVCAVHFANSYIPGEKVMIDYSGDAVKLNTGSRNGTAVQIFVATLPYSGYIFIHATEHQRREDWLESIAALYKKIGGVCEQLLLDNSTPLVTKADKVDPLLSKSFTNFCRQYGVEPIALPPHQPRAKAPVERAVGIVEQLVFPRLAAQPLLSIGDINCVLEREMDVLNNRVLTDGSKQTRLQRFEEESHFLKSLPGLEYDPNCSILDRKILDTNQVRVNNVRYGVRWGHVGEVARLFINTKKNRVDIYLRDTLEFIGSSELFKPGTKVPTGTADLPEALRRYREGVSQLLTRVETEVGPKSLELANHLVRYAGSNGPRHLNGLLTLSHDYSSDTMERVCGEILNSPSKTYKALLTALSLEDRKKRKNAVNKKEKNNSFKPAGACVRGPDYYRNRVAEKKAMEEGNEEW